MPTKLITAPAYYPLTLNELKEHLRETTSDNDNIIFNVLKSATLEAENYTWRKLVTQTWEYYFDKFQ